jgi:hypothetical protein
MRDRKFAAPERWWDKVRLLQEDEHRGSISETIRAAIEEKVDARCAHDRIFAEKVSRL